MTEEDQASVKGDQARYEKAMVARRNNKAFQIVDPGDSDWSYRKNPDGTIEIAGAPEAHKGAVGMVLKEGDKFFQPINELFVGPTPDVPYKEPGSSTTAPAKKAEEAEEAPAMSNKDKAQAVMSDSISGMGEEIETSKPDRMVDGRNISATARRLSKRNRLVDDKMNTVRDME
jgi:hypothetical protein